MGGFATQISGTRSDGNLAWAGAGGIDSAGSPGTHEKTADIADRAEAKSRLARRTGGAAQGTTSGMGRMIMRLPWGLNARHLYLGFFSVISIALCGFSMVIYSQYTRVQNLNAYTIRQYEVIRQSRGILTDVLNMETGVRGYVMSGQKTCLLYTSPSPRDS